MLQKTFCNLVLLSCVLLLSSCAVVSTQQVELNSQFKQAQSPETLAPTGAKINVGDFTDLRGYDDPHILSHKVDGWNNTNSASFLLKQPVAEVFKKMLRHSLSQQNYQLSPKAQLTLTGNLSESSFNYLQNLFSTNVTAKFEVTFELIDNKTNQIVWRQTIMGANKPGNSETTTHAFITHEIIVAAFQEAIENALYQLESSTGFQEVIAKYR